MKKLSQMAALCVFAMLVLVSCSDDTTTPAADKNYYPTTIGSTWTYDGVDTEDTTGTLRTIPGSEYTTTTTVASSLTYMGKAATMNINTSTQAGATTTDTIYRSKSGSQIYTYINLLPAEALSGFGVNLDLGSRWVLEADFNQSSWTILPDTTIKGLTFDVSGTSLTVDVTLKITGTKKETSTMTVSGSSVVAQKFTTTFSVILKSSGLEVPFSINSDTYFAENIGIVKTEVLPITITFPFPLSLQFPPIHIDGNRETLKTYVIAK